MSLNSTSILGGKGVLNSYSNPNTGSFANGVNVPGSLLAGNFRGPYGGNGGGFVTPHGGAGRLQGPYGGSIAGFGIPGVGGGFAAKGPMGSTAIGGVNLLNGNAGLNLNNSHTGGSLTASGNIFSKSGSVNLNSPIFGQHSWNF